MRKFDVSMPFAGRLTMTVEAVDEESAKNRFYDIINDANNHIGFDVVGLDKVCADVEWDFYEHISEGNVINCPNSDIEITENVW